MNLRAEPAGPLPWRVTDLVVLWVGVVAGATLLLLAWWGASATANETRQVAWIDLGACGVIVAGAALVSWVLAGRRAIGARRVRLLPDVAPSAEASDAQPEERLVSAPRHTRYHRADCPMVAGKATRAATAARHRTAGRQPCGVCRPSQ